MLIWGGSTGECCLPSGEGYLADGAAYDPAARTWRRLPAAPIKGRVPFSVWTGEELIVWGNADQGFRMRDGAAFDPRANSWRTISEAPADITLGSAVWTGEEMIVVGAALGGNNHADTDTAIGIAYDPTADTWRQLPSPDLSPQAVTASWLGGGDPAAGRVIAWDYDHASEAYDPVTDTWWSLDPVPLRSFECRPVSHSVGGTVFGEFCGQTVVFSPEEDAWHRDPMPVPDVEAGCCWVHEPVVADDVVLVPSVLYDEPPARTAATDRRMFAYNPPPLVRADERGEVVEPEPFFPETERDGDLLRMPVVFPDGSSATLVYPIPLMLETMGVQPDVSYVWRDDPPPRYPIVFLHDANASIARFVDEEGPTRLFNTGCGGVEVWRASGNDVQRRFWIKYELDSWTVLVSVRDALESAIEVHCALRIVQTDAGFPFVEASGPLALAEGFGEAEGAELSFGDGSADPDAVSQLDATIFLSPDGCDGEPGVSGTYGSTCVAGGGLFASIYGDREFVKNVVTGLRGEDFQAGLPGVT